LTKRSWRGQYQFFPTAAEAKIAPINAGTNFRAEFFNIFNHPNFGRPNNNLTDPASANRPKC
jgi:hypothetical protein